MIRVVVAAPPHVAEPRDLEALPPSADWIELRLDLLDVEDVRPWIEASPRPVLVTLRSKAEGGRFDGDPAEAARILVEAAKAGAAGIDVEIPVAGRLDALPRGVKVVVSHHGEGEPDWPPDVAGRPFRRKLARPVYDAASWERMRREPLDATCSVVPYGPLGAARGAWIEDDGLLYGSAGVPVVEGQPGLVELLDDLRASEVSKDARLFGLLGRPPVRSPSPAIHNAAFRHLGQDALYVPLPAVDPEVALALPFQGFSVTMPHKLRALELADEVEAGAREVGAANTLVRDEDGRWIASNTDVEAIEASLPTAEGAGALVYGAGGYARAAVRALERRGYRPRLAARDEARGRDAAEGLGVVWAGTQPAQDETDRVLVNATPLGKDGAPPAPFARWRFDDLLVLDAPYADAGCRTGFAQVARAYVDGRTLLLRQATGQIRRFAGSVPDVVATLALEDPLPLVLLGLRGAGKSRVARHVARRLGRPWLDLDLEVKRVTGHSPSWWLRQRGESAFRDAELRVVHGLRGRRGVVVAAGGGVLEHPDAAAVLREHTWPVLLDVPPAVAAERARRDAKDRPRLVPGATEEQEAVVLHRRRHDGWLAIAHAVIDATPAPEVVAENVAQAWIDACLPVS